MERNEFPLVVSPSLGCPEIVSVEDLKKGGTIPLVVAGRFGEINCPLRCQFEGIFFLRPADGGKDIPLTLASDPEEIVDWDVLTDLCDLSSTRAIQWLLLTAPSRKPARHSPATAASAEPCASR